MTLNSLRPLCPDQMASLMGREERPETAGAVRGGDR
jgi:hypothetical protein